METRTRNVRKIMISILPAAGVSISISGSSLGTCGSAGTFSASEISSESSFSIASSSSAVNSPLSNALISYLLKYVQ